MSWHNQKDEERGQSQHYSPDRDLEKRAVSCLNAFGLSENRSSKAATCADIRELFVEDSLGLYLLSFLLTADQKKAEKDAKKSAKQEKKILQQLGSTVKISSILVGDAPDVVSKGSTLMPPRFDEL